MRAARWALTIAPWLVLAVIALLWWRGGERPPAGPTAAAAPAAVESRPTKTARHWRRRTIECTDGVQFSVREPSEAELRAAALRYGLVVEATPAPASSPPASMSSGTPSETVAGFRLFEPGGEHRAIAAVFAEQIVPRLRWGGTVLPHLDDQGELHLPFVAAERPRVEWTLGTWGGGCEWSPYAEIARVACYALWEPVAVRGWHLRLLPGAELRDGRLEPLHRVTLEWRN